MVTDAILAAVQGIIDNLNTAEERRIGESVMSMLSDFDENEWYKRNDEQRNKWLNQYYSNNMNSSCICSNEEQLQKEKENMALFIIQNWHHCPIPIEMECTQGFKQPGCVECLLRHVDSLNFAKED